MKAQKSSRKISVAQANLKWAAKKTRTKMPNSHPWKNGLTCMPRSIDNIH